MLTRVIKIQLVLLAAGGGHRGGGLGGLLPANTQPCRHRPIHPVCRFAAVRGSVSHSKRHLPGHHHRQGRRRRTHPAGCARDAERRRRLPDPGQRLSQCALGIGSRRAVPGPGVDRQPAARTCRMGRRSPKARSPARSARRWMPPSADWRYCPKTRSHRCCGKHRRPWAGWGRPFSAWSTPPAGDRPRLQGQHRRHQRHHRAVGTHHRQPGRFR